MNKFTIITITFFTLLQVGCTTFHASQPSAELVASVNSNIKADIEVGEKISGKSRVVTLFGFINFGDDKFSDGINYGSTSGIALEGRSIDEAKSAASYNAVSISKADVIVLPRYTIEVTNFLLFKTTDVSVIGNKGVIKSFKSN